MKLTPKHYQAIELLAIGTSLQNVAEQLEVARETVSRWKADCNFQAELNSLLHSNHQETQDKLRHLSRIALETIEHVMTDKETPAKDRLTASLKILEINRLRESRIGSSNPVTLKKQCEDDKLLDSYGF